MAVAEIPIDRFDGLDSCKDVPNALGVFKID